MTARRVSAMPAHAYVLSWRQVEQDRKDAELFRVYTALRQAVNPRARMMLLSGLAAFDRSI